MVRYIRISYILSILYLLSTRSMSEGRLFLPGVMNYFSCDTVYKVKEGDSCIGIAQKFDIKLSLLRWKNKDMKCPPYIGTRLCVDDWI